MKHHELPGHISEKLHAIAERGEKIRILFVCLGNICRSPAAEGIMRDIVDSRGDSQNWKIDSAGTGRYHIGDLPCRQVTQDDFNDFDLIIGMDASNITNLRQIAPSPEAEKKIVAMADFFTPGSRYDYVPDPYYEGSEGFELVLDLLEDACRNLYDSAS